jgi:hypothetical protein
LEIISAEQFGHRKRVGAEPIIGVIVAGEITKPLAWWISGSGWK